MAEAQYRKPVDDNVPWQQRLANYAQNPSAGRSEYQRAMEVFRGKSAAGDTTGATAAKTWMDQVNTAIGGTGAQDDSRSQLSELRSRSQTVNPEIMALQQQLKERINRPVQQFSYNPEADPAYQAQKRIIEQDTARDMNNARVEAGAVGMRGGSLQNNQLMQASLRNQQRLQNEITPQLMSQAYQRYIGNQQAENQQLNNMMQLTNMYNDQDQQQYARLAQVLGLQNQLDQQQVENDRAATQQALQLRQANLGAAASVGQQLGRVLTPKDDWSNLYNQDEAPLNMQAQQVEYQKARDQIADEQYKQKFDEDVRRFGLEYALKQAAQANQFANTVADNARANAALGLQASNQNMNNLFKIWEATGVAPEGIQGVKAGTPMAGKQAAPKSTDYKNNPDFADEIATIQANPTNALSMIQQNAQSLIQAYGYDGYQALLKAATPDK